MICPEDTFKLNLHISPHSLIDYENLFVFFLFITLGKDFANIYFESCLLRISLPFTIYFMDKLNFK